MLHHVGNVIIGIRIQFELYVIMLLTTADITVIFILPYFRHLIGVITYITCFNIWNVFSTSLMVALMVVKPGLMYFSSLNLTLCSCVPFPWVIKTMHFPSYSLVGVV